MTTIKIDSLESVGSSGWRREISWDTDTAKLWCPYYTREPQFDKESARKLRDALSQFLGE